MILLPLFKFLWELVLEKIARIGSSSRTENLQWGWAIIIFCLKHWHLRLLLSGLLIRSPRRSANGFGGSNYLPKFELLAFGILPVRVLLMNRKMGWDPFCPFCLTHFEWTTRFFSALVRSSLFNIMYSCPDC